MDHLLEVSELTGGYAGRRPVLHEVSFHIGKGEMVGMVGLNGAGKSTTIKHILGLMEPQSGSVRFRGQTITEDLTAYRSNMAYIPETPQLYEQLTLREHLELTAMAYNLDVQEVTEKSAELAQLFRMEKRMDWFPAHFSKGMKQKAMIMCAFLVRPELYIVDEPFIGLDPVGIEAFLENMLAMKRNGAGVLMSTHILSTAEAYCDRLIILHEGKIVTSGTMSELREQFRKPDATLHDIYVDVAGGVKPWSD